MDIELNQSTPMHCISYATQCIEKVALSMENDLHDDAVRRSAVFLTTNLATSEWYENFAIVTVASHCSLIEMTFTADNPVACDFAPNDGYDFILKVSCERVS